jgi:hypothetical protein
MARGVPAAWEPAILFLLANAVRQLVGISVGIGSNRRLKITSNSIGYGIRRLSAKGTTLRPSGYAWHGHARARRVKRVRRSWSEAQAQTDWHDANSCFNCQQLIAGQASAFSQRVFRRSDASTLSLLETEGAGKTGCWSHPRPRVQCRKQGLDRSDFTKRRDLPVGQVTRGFTTRDHRCSRFVEGA